ncbi:Gfo/Idh/MocA family oxidoreductase [Arthrobacter sp. ATA002]|uniref:Gfo/Idh/MocA family protein n=1 Tax=Arthrobacter sp. ATA002 TaxID=2991715 RepID=UPI0022A7235C|nr:Gfo/Idh/MocA family oxidoreductase [Arthrobacter sp. ATA002]WAP51551.1 Gfo/Idh/MocA family oxidoreductase [Arthrobacter sp. ATA002]
MTRLFRTAIVGTGGIAQAHARSMSTLKDRAQVVAAVDIDPARLAEFCDKWDIANRYSSLTELLAAEELDVVHLCTPPGFHKGQAIEALRSNVNVLSEKPPALTLADMDEIAEAEAASAACFATVFQHRFGSGAENLKRLMGEDGLGRPLAAICNTLWYRPDSYFDLPWRGQWLVEGGGPTMGHGIHQFDLLLSILGNWTEVTAVAARQALPTNTEDFSAAIVSFENGTVATIINSLLAPKETSYLRFDFSGATVELEHLYGYSDDSWALTPAPGHEDLERRWKEGLTGRASGHSSQFAAIFDALASGGVPPVTSTESRMTMELIAAIYASAFTRKPVSRGQIDTTSPFYGAMDGNAAPWSDVKASH